MTERGLAAEEAWRLLLAIREEARRDPANPLPWFFRLTDESAVPCDSTAVCDLQIDTDENWSVSGNVSSETEQLIDLHLPMALAGPTRPFALAQLGQSLDGRIATEDGQSHYITGKANLVHLHRLRALCDAVIVGAGTVAADDPRLTTRHVSGPNPVRIVLDPDLRLGADYRLLTDDVSPTLIACRTAAAQGETDSRGLARFLPVWEEDGEPSMAAVCARLRADGLHALFIEGGGVTIARFLAEGLLDRLHLAIAPLLLGSGRAAFPTTGLRRLSDAPRFSYRHAVMGDDLLLDLDLRTKAVT